MAATITRRATLIGLAASVPLPLGAEPASKQKPSEDYAVLDRPAVRAFLTALGEEATRSRIEALGMTPAK